MDKNTLNWRFDVNTFRLIGRDLITDRITAIFELVKNSYDANAQKVQVKLFDVVPNLLHSKIIIKDDGLGMSLEDIQNKWMVVGTASKRQTSMSSPAPYNRKYVGEKGIGRFAVDKLGGNVVIRTKKEGEKQWLNVELNWENYEKLAEQQELTLFTDVENAYFFEDAENENEHGTELIITKIRETWTESNLQRLSKELTKIVSPLHPLNPPFHICLYANEFEKQFDGKTPLVADIIDFYSHKAEIKYHIDKENPENSYQEVLSFDTVKKIIYTAKKTIQLFGGISMQLFYFNLEAKAKFNKYYSSVGDTRIDGIKIYRDGVVTTPFAEMEEHRERKKDILGIDKRLRRDTFTRISIGDILGMVYITKEQNPQITDATGRQDFKDTKQYRELKEFIIEQLYAFEQVKLFERSEKSNIVSTNLEKGKENFENFENQVKNLEKEINKLKPELKPALVSLKQEIKETKEVYKRGVDLINEERKEFVRKESMYLSLLSTQMYSVQVAHAMRTKIGSVKDMADFFSRRYPDEKFEAKFKEYAKLIHTELQELQHVTDFMLSYAKADMKDIKEFNIKKTIEELLNKTYEIPFGDSGITPIIEMKDCVISGHKQFFKDIFQQLISNSMKALENVKEKKIRCSGYVEKDGYIILFSDNGYGIAQGKEDRIFDMFYTTTAEQGGAGIGLWVAKNRIAALEGTIQVVENEFKPTGATFKITIPFNRK